MPVCVCVFFIWASLVAQKVKNPPAMRETWVQSLGREDPLEEGMATHSSILVWRIPMDRGAWWATVHRVTKSQTQLKQLSMHACTHRHTQTQTQTHTHTHTHTHTYMQCSGKKSEHKTNLIVANYPRGGVFTFYLLHCWNCFQNEHVLPLTFQKTQ